MSRKDLFEDISEPVGEPVVDLEFDEVNVDVVSDDGQDTSAFQLFGGQTMTIDLNAEDDDGPVVTRPDSYYFAVSGADRERCILVAVTGEDILEQAARELAIAASSPPAPDINEGWIKPRRKCRPGKSARKNRKELNIKREQQRKEEQQRWRRRPKFNRR